MSAAAAAAHGVHRRLASHPSPSSLPVLRTPGNMDSSICRCSAYTYADDDIDWLFLETLQHRRLQARLPKITSRTATLMCVATTLAAARVTCGRRSSCQHRYLASSTADSRVTDGRRLRVPSHAQCNGSNVSVINSLTNKTSSTDWIAWRYTFRNSCQKWAKICTKYVNTKVTLLGTLWIATETRSSAVGEEPREHTVSWNRVECCTNVRRIAFEKACNLWTTFKVIQGHCRCCHLIGHIRFPISLPCKCISILHRFRDINTY